MSDTGSGSGRRLPNRGVVIKPFRAGEPVGQPLGDRAYLTPRFPSGIKRNQLRWERPEVQRETILLWYIRNYERPRGPYFGFGEASKASAAAGSDAQVLDGGVSLDRGFQLDGGTKFDGSGRFGGAAPELQGLEIGGFDQAPFYDGGPADKFLREELADWINQEILSDITEALPGQWVPKRDVMMPGAEAGADELRAALSRLLDRFDAGIRSAPAREVNRWDNQPPEKLPDELPVLALEERDLVLRATADMRMSVLSEDYSLAGQLWASVLPALAKVAAFVQEQAVALVGDVRKQLATATRLVALDWGIRVLEHSEAIDAVLKAVGLR